MPILQIEHQIADLDAWLREFASRAAAREQAGVTAVQVLQAEGDPQHIVELLYFDTLDSANSYRKFMREQVWASFAPGLASNPQTIILNELKINGLKTTSTSGP
ncbi:hypothetical protein [Mycobacterium interjectum]|uniref:hypothetical protein n=1 Tax=Mycobacterium interjectum TaxID=33895 RepID=UPI00082BF109|nr:hypothetical protein [Mycobacterium interjectum]MCV7090063.1 hypothetical protein [Mycobacterium interjectum]